MQQKSDYLHIEYVRNKNTEAQQGDIYLIMKNLYYFLYIYFIMKDFVAITCIKILHWVLVESFTLSIIFQHSLKSKFCQACAASPKFISGR